MIRFRLLRSGSLLLAALLVASCSEPTGPESTLQGSSISASSLDLQASKGSDKGDAKLDLHGVWWEDHYKSEYKVSRTIGAAGGRITIPETGLTVDFPAGALSRDVSITVTSDKKYVAYRFAPDGLRFDKEVIVTQSLRNTEFEGRLLREPLFAAYLDDRAKLSGKIKPLEILPTNTIFSLISGVLRPQAQVWNIRHFSRYMLASG
jgi:hypothetical protein